MNTKTSQRSVRTVADEKDCGKFTPGEAFREDPAVIKKQIPAMRLLPVLALCTASLVGCDKKDPDPGGPDSEPNADQFRITCPATKSTQGGNLPRYRGRSFHQTGEIQSGSSPVLYSLLRDPQ